MKRRYRALRAIINIYQLAAVTIGVLGVIGGVGMMFTRVGGYTISGIYYPGESLFFQGLTVVIGSLLTSLGLAAFSQVLELLIHIEENTRNTALRLGRMVAQSTQKRTRTRSEADEWDAVLEG
jgi:glutamine cyclotransferase